MNNTLTIPEDLSTPLAYNTKLAKLLQGLKRDAGATNINQNYRGTGSRAYRRQLFVGFKSGKVTDLWLEADRVELGGVTKVLGKISHNGRTPEEVYTDVAHVLKAWATA